MGALADGGISYLTGFAKGLTPDPSLWVDQWADEYMRIPRGNGASPASTVPTAPRSLASRCVACRRNIRPSVSSRK